MTTGLQNAQSESAQSTDDLSVATDTAVTPLETFQPDSLDNVNNASHDVKLLNSYQMPEAGSTYMIRSVQSREYLTLLRGEVVVAPAGVLGSHHWECVRLDGWLGFRNVASYGFLGRDGSWTLCCGAQSHREWEKFHVLSKEEGGFIMLMTHWGKLRPVDFKEEQGVKRLAMVEVESDNGVLWEFVKV